MLEAPMIFERKACCLQSCHDDTNVTMPRWDGNVCQPDCVGRAATMAACQAIHVHRYLKRSQVEGEVESWRVVCS